MNSGDTYMKTVLITGGGRGLGLEFCRVFLENGWSVFPLVRSEEIASELAAVCGKACHPIVSDVVSELVAEDIAGVLGEHTDSLDLLINNAGNAKKHIGLDRTEAEDIESVFRVHCIGAFRCTKAVLPFLRKAEGGKVINITSRWGSISHTAAGGGCGIYSYQIAKSAQNMLTACLDRELREEGIRVLAVHPGQLMTKMAAPDADTDPREAAQRLVRWIEREGGSIGIGYYDLMRDAFIEW